MTRGIRRACAAEGYERELAWIMPTLNRDHTDGFFHVGVDYAHHAGGKLFQRQTALIFLEPLSNDLLRARQVQLKVAAKKLVGGEATQQQVGVGNGGTLSFAVTDWAGISAGRLGPHAQSTARIETRQRSSTRADGVNIQHRYAHRQTGDISFVCGCGLSIYQRDIGRSSAHIKGDDAVKTATLGDGRCANNASGGP
jgi:hypothetical protein